MSTGRLIWGRALVSRPSKDARLRDRFRVTDNPLGNPCAKGDNHSSVALGDHELISFNAISTLFVTWKIQPSNSAGAPDNGNNRRDDRLPFQRPACGHTRPSNQRN